MDAFGREPTTYTDGNLLGRYRHEANSFSWIKTLAVETARLPMGEGMGGVAPATTDAGDRFPVSTVRRGRTRLERLADRTRRPCRSGVLHRLSRTHQVRDISHHPAHRAAPYAGLGRYDRRPVER